MANRKLDISKISQIVMLASTTDMPNYEIAKQFGISPRRVGQIINEHKGTIDEKLHDNIMLAIDSATGTSVASRAWRMKQYEKDLIKLDHQHTPDAINARTKILGQVAKELGDVEPVQHSIKAEVSHIIGIDMNRALPASATPAITAEVIEITDGS